MTKSKIFVLCLLLLSVASLCVFTWGNIRLSDNDVLNDLLSSIISRGIVTCCIVCVAIILKQKSIFVTLNKPIAKNLLWCLPCLLVALANFPFSALLSGSAVIVHKDLILPFVLDCFIAACVEEIIFRGILLSEMLSKTDNKLLTSILIESGLFALSHLLNLFVGAGFGATALQIGYTFLIGIMFSFVIVKTGNVFVPILLHTVFNVGGQIVTTLGNGHFQDTIFWMITIICAILCTLHILNYYLHYRKDKKIITTH